MMLDGLAALSVEIRTKRSTLMPPRGFGDRPGAADVVLDGLAGVRFHQRHVLVGGGMEDEMRPVLGEDGIDAIGVGDVADDRTDRRRVAHARPDRW